MPGMFGEVPFLYFRPGETTQQAKDRAFRAAHPSMQSVWQYQFLPDFLKGPAADAGTLLGMDTLRQILAQRGKTDPRVMNQNLAAINRGTTQQQGSLQGFLANAGLQGSGIGQALGASIGQAGQQRASDYRAHEAQLAEERKRSDLDLVLRMIMQPQMDWTALGLGQYNADRSRSDQRSADKASGFADFADQLLKIWGLSKGQA